MMLLPNPKRLMLGYLLGALATSITPGLVIVFSLEGSNAVRTTENALSPAATMTFVSLPWLRRSCSGRAVIELLSIADARAGKTSVRHDGDRRCGGVRYGPRSSSARC
jgi:hypothetical protein